MGVDPPPAAVTTAAAATTNVAGAGSANNGGATFFLAAAKGAVNNLLRAVSGVVSIAGCKDLCAGEAACLSLSYFDNSRGFQLCRLSTVGAGSLTALVDSNVLNTNASHDQYDVYAKVIARATPAPTTTTTEGRG